MNKTEFIAAMEAQLIRLPKADRDDILNDYESHFVNGVAEGKTEEEVSAKLGDPVELAAVYLEQLPEGAKGAPYIPEYIEPAYESQEQQSAPRAETASNTYSEPVTAAQPAAPAADEPNVTGIVAVVLLSIFVALPILWSIFGIIIGAFGAAIGIGAVSIALIVLGATTAGFGTMAAVGMILLGVALIALAVLVVCLGVLGIKGTIQLVKWYIDLCKKMIGGTSK